MSMKDKWKKKITPEEEAAVKKAMAEQAQNSRSFRDVPEGSYAVVVDKLEVRDGDYGAQICVTFKITEGEYKNSRLFYNGTFDDHFNHGINPTATLLAAILDDEDFDAADIAVIIGHGKEETEDFLEDCMEEVEELGYDLEYEVTTSTKTNSKGKPYVNKTFTITEVYDC